MESIRISQKSPEKQNRCHSPIKTIKHNKDNQTIQFLLSYIQSLGHEAPQTFSPQKFQKMIYEQKSFKIVPAGESQEADLIKKLKIQISDNEFELKKHKEDFAEFKLLFKMEKQKSTKKLKDELEQCKKKLHEENIRWEKKFHDRMIQYENQTRQFEIDIKNKYEERKINQLQEIQSELKECKDKLANQLNKTKKKNELQIKQIKQESNAKIQSLIRTHQNQINKLEIKTIDVAKKTEEIYSQKILVIESEKKSHDVLQGQAQKERIKEKDKFITEIYYLKKDKSELKESIDDLEMKIQVFQRKISEKDKLLQLVKCEHLEQSELAAAEYKKEIIRREEYFERQKLEIMKEHYEKLKRYQETIQKLEKSKNDVMSLHQQQMKAIQKQFNSRPSKKEDIDVIKFVQNQLTQKDKEIEKFYQEYKHVQLERENNEKIYTRIFTSSGSREKKIYSTRETFKDYKEVFQRMKQSQTMDLKHMLKISSKEYA